MNTYLIVKTIHIISATILFGTGIGIAFFMFRSYFHNSLEVKLYAASETVSADYLFTFPAAITQVASGAWLVWKSGYQWTDHWLIMTYALYALAGLCWLPVVWIQIKLRNMLMECVANKSPLPDTYFKLFKVWFLLGWPAFIALVIIFFMMICKPV